MTERGRERAAECQSQKSNSICGLSACCCCLSVTARLSVRMKIIFLCFSFLHLSFVSSGLLSSNDLQPAEGGGLTRVEPQNAAPVNTGRKRPLFARRGQYERQRVQKPKKPPQNDIPPPPDVSSQPVKPRCSQLKQSCLPQSGCCEAGATCHCRFFNAICFCRRTNSLNKKKKT